MPSLLALSYDVKWRHFVHNEIRLSYHRMLARFCPCPIAFREMMRKTHAIITGSTALHYLLRLPEQWTPGDVDIVAPPNHFDTVLKFIINLPDAAVLRVIGDDNEEYNSLTDIGIIRLVKVVTPQAKFDIMKSATSSPFNPLPLYWGTHVMNALTGDSFCCAYPTLTLRRRGILRADVDLDIPTVTAVDKYHDRGFRFYSNARSCLNVGRTCLTCSACPHRDRFFGDKHCLVVPIPIRKESPAIINDTDPTTPGDNTSTTTEHDPPVSLSDAFFRIAVDEPTEHTPNCNTSHISNAPGHQHVCTVRENDWLFSDDAPYTTAWRLGGDACNNSSCFLPASPMMTTMVIKNTYAVLQPL